MSVTGRVAGLSRGPADVAEFRPRTENAAITADPQP
jgi:hypothetical protein